MTYHLRATSVLLTTLLLIACQPASISPNTTPAEEAAGPTAISAPTHTPAPKSATDTPQSRDAQPMTEETLDLDEANVMFVEAIETDDGTWRFDVTVRHNDQGWDHYANGWDVVLPDDTVLKASPDNEFTRVLLHPHDNEQPFTRSQSGLSIPVDVTQVIIRAHCNVHGYGGRSVVVDLTKEQGEGFDVERSSSSQ